MTEVLFPQLSAERGDAEGVVATWYVATGESVGAGQPLADVQMDKVNAEVPAPVAGTVTLLVGEGESVRQGSVIARLD
jgi:pyruvate/2-oxoglutarate dehydrogenase complex dihydrolipoamide acyltransferase (E2) component